MPRRRIKRTLEEEEEFQQWRREKRNENQRRRRQIEKENNITKMINCRNRVIEFNNEAREENINFANDNNPQTNNPNIELNNCNVANCSNNLLINQQHMEYQVRYRSRIKKQPLLNINNTTLKNVVEYYIGSMDVICIHCNAKYFAAEKISNKGNSFHDCCNHGAVNLQPLPELPEFLKSLFDGSHIKSNDFFNHIRSYNSSFSFASFNANLVNFQERRPGPYCFKIHGQIYYQINTALYATQNENPTYGQLFIVDSNEAINHRLNKNSYLDSEIVTKLECLMRECSIFAQSYQMMAEEIENQQRLETECGESFSELQLLFTLKPGMDRHRYNIQKINEVAAVFKITSDGEIPDSYVTIRNRNTKILQQVSTMDPNV